MPTNLDTRLINVNVATSETTIAHSLGRTPVDGFIVTRTSGANVFRGTTPWTSTNIYLQASAAVGIALLIF